MWARCPARLAGDHIVNGERLSHARVAGAGMEEDMKTWEYKPETAWQQTWRGGLTLGLVVLTSPLTCGLWINDFVRWCGITQPKNNNTKHGDAPATGLSLEAGNE